MNALERRMEEDRRLRNEAKALLREELGHAKGKVAPSALRDRLAETIGNKAVALGEQLGDLAERHGRKIAIAGLAAAGATGVWLARQPILSGFSALASRFRGSSKGGAHRTPEKEADDE